MKRECLLSSSYIGAPMKLGGIELVYSALVNETVRLLKCSFLTKGTPDQSDHGGLVECVMVMYWIATGDKQAVREHLKKTVDERNEAMVLFYLEHEEDVESVKAGIIERMQAAAAASIETEAGGKSGTDATRVA